MGLGGGAARVQGGKIELSNQNQSTVMGTHSREGLEGGQNSVFLSRFHLFGLFLSRLWESLEAEAGLVCGMSSLRASASS